MEGFEGAIFNDATAQCHSTTVTASLRASLPFVHGGLVLRLMCLSPHKRALTKAAHSLKDPACGLFVNVIVFTFLLPEDICSNKLKTKDSC